MRAETALEVGLDGRGVSVLTSMRCEAPLVVRVAQCAHLPGEPLHLSFVNAAAGPLGGDELVLTLRVHDGARVVVRSVGASMAQPGPRGGSSTSLVHVVVGEEASLDWAPLPTISVTGSEHHARSDLAVARSADVHFGDAVSLGRHGEPPGSLAVRQRVERAGSVLLDHETSFGAGVLASAGANGGYRSISSTIVLGGMAPSTPAVSIDRERLDATYPLAPDAALVVTAAR